MKFRWRELLIAFLLAVGIWYVVTGSEKVESQIEVRADYRGLPQGLVIRSGTVSKVSVRVRAAVGMIHSLSSRDFAFFVDLSPVKKGENALPVNTSQLVLPGGVEVIDVTPSRIYLDVDSVESKTVPVVAHVQGELPGDYAAEANVTPAEAKISGASSLLDGINKLTIPVALEKPLVPGITENKRMIPLPDGVECAPAEAKVVLHVGIKRKLVQVSRTVTGYVPDEFGLYVRPDKVQISLAMPDSQAGKAASHDGIKAFVRLERYELGSYVLPIQVSLPEGAELVKVEPTRVSVTVEQKQQSRQRPQPAKTPSAKKAPAKPQPSKTQPARPQAPKPQTAKPQAAKTQTPAQRAAR